MTVRRGGDDPLRDSWPALSLAILLLVVVAAFTLAAYRAAVGALVEERHRDALAVGRTAAAILRTRGPIGPADLLRLAPQASGVALLDPGGEILARAGEPFPSAAPPWVDGEPPREESVRGPDAETAGQVVALVPVEGRGWLRVALPAPLLEAQRRTVGLLSWVVGGSVAAVAIWLLLFLRRLLGPYGELLARAQELRSASGAEAAGAESDAELLLQTFEGALAALRGEADVEVLERTLGAHPGTGLILLDEGERVLVLNPAAADRLGVSAPAPRLPLTALLEERPEALAAVRRAIAAGGAVPQTAAIPGARDRSVDLTATPLVRRDGTPLGHLILVADATAALAARRETQLAESLAHLGELAAGVAHELRNGLATVIGYLELLERSDDPVRRAGHLAEIDRETRQLQRVVADFLAFARPETARPEPVDLARLLGRILAEPAFSVARFEPEEGADATIQGDPSLLARAFRNLLANAVEAEARVGVAPGIVVRAGCNADAGWTATVCDRGPGIPAEIRSRLFRPFVSGRPDGVGLGLALAHRILALHGGTLRIDDRPGGGACARVEFPADVVVRPAAQDR